MNRCDWIVCERTNRWAAALRVAVARQSQPFPAMPRLIEVRSLGELSQRLAASPAALACCEVHAGNLADSLRWIGDTRRCFPLARILALVDDSLRACAAANAEVSAVDRNLIVDALCEVGAIDVADSPRYLHHVLAVAKQHAAAPSPRNSYNSDPPLLEWALEQLPWQSS